MESSGLVGESLSPESTVTSLLSSSGHLRNRPCPPNYHYASFTYRDQDYDSASAALDAYIEDFRRSHWRREPLSTRLLLPHIKPSTPWRTRVGIVRNKDVLTERLTEQELDFLSLPVNALHHSSNQDRLSMTTDELLSIPDDGSQPVTHTSAFLQGLLSGFGASGPPNHQNNLHRSLPTRMQKNSRETPKPAADLTADRSFKSARRSLRSQQAEISSSSLHWFTSNKLHHLEASGISRESRLQPPVWIKNLELCDPPPSSELWDQHGTRPTGPPSWVADMGQEEEEQDSLEKRDSQQLLRDLRLQFAEQISHLATERCGSDSMSALFRDNRIESLIQKTDEVLNSLTQTPARPEVSPTHTEELLPSSPSRPPPSSQDSAAAVTESGRGVQGLSGSSSWKQPGPAEAIKQMLFRLQAVEAELERQQQPLEAPADTDQTPIKQRPGDEQQLQSIPGRPSLQKALYHLSRLKLLVEEPEDKRMEEEKDEDEGRYSSLSADALICSQPEPS